MCHVRCCGCLVYVSLLLVLGLLLQFQNKECDQQCESLPQQPRASCFPSCLQGMGLWCFQPQGMSCDWSKPVMMILSTLPNAFLQISLITRSGHVTQFQTLRRKHKSSGLWLERIFFLNKRNHLGRKSLVPTLFFLLNMLYIRVWCLELW